MNFRKGNRLVIESVGGRYLKKSSSGYILMNYIEASSDIKVSREDDLINCVSNSFFVFLPSAIPGDPTIIKNSGAGVIKVTSSCGELIDGQLIQTLNQYDSITIVGANSGWIIV